MLKQGLALVMDLAKFNVNELDEDASFDHDQNAFLNLFNMHYKLIQRG